MTTKIFLLASLKSRAMDRSCDQDRHTSSVITRSIGIPQASARWGVVGHATTRIKRLHQRGSSAPPFFWTASLQ